MNPLASDDKLPASFFSALYPELEQTAPEPVTATDGAHDPRLQRLIEQWPGAVFCLDNQLRCWLLNREARSWCAPDTTTTGVALNELLPQPLMELLLPYLSAAIRGLELAFNEACQHPKLGTRQLAIRTQPDHDGGLVAGVILHMQDITDLLQAQRLAEEPARQTQQHHAATPPTERLQLMAQNLRDAAIFTLDVMGHITDWPASAQRLLGFSEDEVLGQSVQRFDAPGRMGETPETLLALERATLLGQYESTGWRVRQDGQRFWAQLTLTSLHDPETQESLGYACLMRDMTEIKRLEDLLRQWNQELEQRVQERTRQLQDINQDLEAFSYSVSHDLRAPLRHIGSFVELLREDLGNEAAGPTLKHLDTIAQSATHMGQLIEGLLAFSRLGRAPLARRKVDMGDVLRSSLNRVQHDPLLQRPEGCVRWHIAADLPVVQGDGLLLSQVWENLLSNALKYSRRREPAEITVAWQVGTDGEWQFRVSDNGVGFDPRRADRLFGVFQRLHRTTDFEGTGIGLALCRRILERHGGRIWADSEPGVGSNFWFALPVSPTIQPAAAPSADA